MVGLVRAGCPAGFLVIPYHRIEKRMDSIAVSVAQLNDGATVMTTECK